MPLTVCPEPADLRRLHRGGLPEAEVEALEQHLMACDACIARLKATLAEPDTLTDAFAGQTLIAKETDPNVRTLIKRLETLPAASSAVRGSAMIAITCSSCQKKLSVKEELAGKKVKCPGCGAATAVPARAKVPVETRTQPAAPARADMATLPPEAGPSAAEQPTPPPPSLADPTEGIKPAAGDGEPDSSLTDFLSPPQAPDELGRLGKYRILKVLGHGGMGVVYKAEDPKLKRSVAIKAMLPTLAASASAGKRFLREAEAMAALEHDHVVRVYQVDEDRGVPYLAMEFLKGEPLDVRLHRGEKISVSEVMRIGSEIAEALSAAHAKNLIHRDIKPGNIWLEARPEASPGRKSGVGRVKILDFGLARATSQDSGLTQQGAIVGTPAYMAPEQARGDTVDARCDLWALGVVLYRVSTGVQPFVGKDTVSTLMAVAMQEPKPPHELNAEIPIELSNLVMHLLEKDPEKRLDSAEEVVERLRSLEAKESLAHQDAIRLGTRKMETHVRATAPALQPGVARDTVSLPDGRGSDKARSRRWLMIGILLPVLALVAASVVFFLQTPHGTVRVEINDPKIKVAINGDEVQFDGANNKQISVKAGQNGLTVQRDDFTFDTTKFELKKGETIALKIDWFQEGKVQIALDGKMIGEKTHEARVAANVLDATKASGLAFDGTQRVDIPELPLDLAAPLTLEAYATFPKAFENGDFIELKDCASLGVRKQFNRLHFWHHSSAVLNGMSSVPTTKNRKFHVAGVWTGKEMQLYVNGVLEGTKGPKGNKPKVMAAGVLGKGFSGVLSEVRISKCARYDKDFIPAKRFEADADTLVLYHCDEGQGDVLKDSSGNGRHGKIVGAQWVKVAGLPIPASVGSSYALGFDGQGHVSIASLRVQADQPFTIEAAVTPRQVGPKFRGTVAAFPKSIVLSAENSKWSFGTPMLRAPGADEIVANQKTRLAGVYADSLFSLFVDGKLINRSRLTTPPTNDLFDEAFLLGKGLHGTLGEVRISKVARYAKDYVPKERFEPDADTLALYHMDEGEGDVLTDSSGNGHHGKIVGAKWVRDAFAPQGIDWALQFDGSGQVNFEKSLDYKSDSFTIEGLVRVDKAERLGTVYVFGQTNGVMLDSTEGNTWRFSNVLTAGGHFGIQENPPVEVGRRLHFAAVADANGFSFYLDGKKIGKTAKGRLRLLEDLRPGTRPMIGKYFYGLLNEVRISSVPRYSADFTPPGRHVADPQTLALYHMDEGQGDVLTDSSGNGHHGKIVGAKWVKAEGAAMASSYALQFDGKTSAVSIPTLKRETDGPLTIETWARPDLDSGIKVVFLLGGKQQWQFNQDRKRWAALDSRCASMFTPVVLNKFAHLAYVADDKEGRFYVDGKLQERTPIGAATMKSPPRPHAWMGATETSGREIIAHFAGLIGPTRVSSAARYDKDFIPQWTFAADKDTVALYHCDEGQGDVLTDSSGNGHHGKIVGAKWVKVDDSLPPAQARSLLFDGDRPAPAVVLNNLQLDLSKPFTMEAYMEEMGPQPKAIRGAIYSLFRVALTAGSFNLMGNEDEKYAHWLNAKEAPLGKVHVAGVSTGKILTLFVNGKAVHSRSIETNLPRSVLAPLSLGYKFGGTLREIHISKIARYDMDFAPAKRFEPDANTLALYHCDEGEGDVLTDSSGNGHHGKIVGAKWVKADGSPIAASVPYALEFNGISNHVSIPSMKIGAGEKRTVELWVSGCKPEGRQGVFDMVGNDSRFWVDFTMTPSKEANWTVFGRPTSTSAISFFYSSIQPAPPSALQHVAVVFSNQAGETPRLFIDGVPRSGATKGFGFKQQMALGTELGASRDDSGKLVHFLAGRLHQVRVSNGARYTNQFAPAPLFETDPQTLALYRFDEGQGDVLTDSSGNGHHGKIVGAKWVKADGSPANPSSRFTLEFDPNSTVDVPSLTEPPAKSDWTLEGYAVISEKSPSGRLFGFASEVFFGFREAPPKNSPQIAHGGYFHGAQSTTFRRGPFPVNLGQRVHFAAVRLKTVIHFYIDGKLVSSMPTPRQTGTFQLGGGFAGSLEHVRISKVGRYANDFVPPARFEPDADTVALYHMDEGQGDVLTDSSGNGHHGKIVGAKWVKVDDPHPRPGAFVPHFNGKIHALRFDNKQSVQIDSLTVPIIGDLTLEAYVTPIVETHPDTPSIFNANGRFELLLTGGRENPTWSLRTHQKNQSLTLTRIGERPRAAFGKRVHVAGVRSADRHRLFVDGELVGESKRVEPHDHMLPLTIGGRAFVGFIDSVRVSKVARYDNEFKPQPRFEPDANTLALYHCDEGEGDVLNDSSGNGHHGKILGAKWVKVDGTLPAPPVAPFALRLERGDVVESPKLDGSHRDFTLEGWFIADPEMMAKAPAAHYIWMKNQAALTFHAPGGWRLSLYNGVGGAVGSVHAPNKAPTAVWTHVATVCQGDRGTVFVNGKIEKQKDGNTTVAMGGHPFQLSDKNVIGSMREVRISKTARYDKDFTPAKRFEPDADTLALYHCDEGQGDVLTDSSGNGHHGKILGAKWVKVEGAPIAPLASRGNSTLAFDGTGKIVGPKFDYKKSDSLTLELFVTPRELKDDKSARVMDLGAVALINLESKSKLWGFYPNQGGRFAPFTPEKRIHLAIVRETDKFSAFVDGKRLGKWALTTPGVDVKAAQLFVAAGFHGEVHGVRISKGARYDNDFDPQSRFALDADTIALYHCDEGEGDVFTDASGNGHHGTIVGAKWVKTAGPPP